MVALDLVCGDVLELNCDVLVLKYAQAFYGADQAVARVLGLNTTWSGPGPGEYLLLATGGQLPCRQVLFCGVVTLWDFGYSEIRQFASEALAWLGRQGLLRGVVGMTMHGVGYGLDEREAFTAQVAGLLEHLTRKAAPGSLQQILIAERDANRYQRLQPLLRSVLLESGYVKLNLTVGTPGPRLPDAGMLSDRKKHVFVAMPYNDEMEDTYEFGIRGPVNEAGCLCERCDHDIFTGDILDRIKTRIANATVVIADMTGSNPNVYLEVGYAWGKGVPTLLIAREGEKLKFDVQTQKCIYYKNITHLRKLLLEYMQKLLQEGGPQA